MKTITKGIVIAVFGTEARTTVAFTQEKKIFNFAPNTALTIYGFIRAEALYDLDLDFYLVFELGESSGRHYDLCSKRPECAHGQ